MKHWVHQLLGLLRAGMTHGMRCVREALRRMRAGRKGLLSHGRRVERSRQLRLEEAHGSERLSGHLWRVAAERDEEAQRVLAGLAAGHLCTGGVVLYANTAALSVRVLYDMLVHTPRLPLRWEEARPRLLLMQGGSAEDLLEIQCLLKKRRLAPLLLVNSAWSLSLRADVERMLEGPATHRIGAHSSKHWLGTQRRSLWRHVQRHALRHRLAIVVAESGDLKDRLLPQYARSFTSEAATR